jgi:hypothetical protein
VIRVQSNKRITVQAELFADLGMLEYLLLLDTVAGVGHQRHRGKTLVVREMSSPVKETKQIAVHYLEQRFSVLSKREKDLS